MGEMSGSRIVYVVPCGAEKADHAAPAADLYTGSMFRHTYQTACQLAAEDAADGADTQVLILSALHGLVDPTAVLDPYNCKMGDEGSITATALATQAALLGIDFGDEVYGFLPKAYYAVLDQALKTLYVPLQDVYEAAPGIGYQRGVNASAARSYAA